MWSLRDSAMGQRNLWPRRVYLSGRSFVFPRLAFPGCTSQPWTQLCLRAWSTLCHMRLPAGVKRPPCVNWISEPCLGIHPQSCLDVHCFVFYSFFAFYFKRSQRGPPVLYHLFHLRKEVASLPSSLILLSSGIQKQGRVFKTATAKQNRSCVRRWQ